MQPIIMQDWITIRGSTSSIVVTMSQADWLLTAPYQDITFYLEIKEISSGTTITVFYDTCPGRDETLFYPMDQTGFTVAATGLTVTNYYTATAKAPVSQWTRWRVTGDTTPWDLTFRVMASGNAIC